MQASILTNIHKKQGTPPAKISDFFYMDAQTLRDKQQQETQQSAQRFVAFLDEKVKKQNGNWFSKTCCQNGSWSGQAT